MKKHLSKRLLSLFLAVLMVVTAAPFAAFGSSNAISDEVNYLFAYFTGQDDENVRLAVSEDGYNFEALNGNEAILRNDPSTIYNVNDTISGIAPSGHARDPYILPQEDGNGYYIIATDLNAIDNGYRNSKLLVWKIDDLSEAANVQPWAVETAGWFSNWNYAVDNSSNGFPDFYAWAPEAIWVESRNQYMMYWSAGTANDGSSIYNSMRIHYAYTSDFQTFYNSAGQEINAANGVTPEILYDPGYRSIDGDITYYNGTYYLWYKNEENKTIHYATSTNSNGPYTYQGQFSNSDYSTGLEGPFVYQLADGTFVLMMDLYNASVGTFLAYAASSPTTEFNNNSIANAVTINYLTPRHGNVCQISTDDYDTLVNTFGKVTFSGRNLVNGESVNDDTLIARYFINDDLNSDATGHNYTLTTSNVTPGVDGNRTYAHFTDNGGDSRNPGSSSYAQTSIAQMMDDYNVNAQDGVTVSFYARSTSTGNERFFELSSFSQPGYVNNNGSNQSEGSYVFYNNQDNVEIHSNGNNISGGSGSVAQNAWHLYTVTVSEKYVAVSMDGVQRSYTPIHSDSFTSDIFDQIMNGNLFIGISSWEADGIFSGDIYDFRIYSKALSNDEVQESLDLLGSSTTVGKELEDVADNRIYYDPMEDMDGGYTAYDQTVETDEMGNVLQTSGSAVTSHYTYNGVEAQNGYTLSFWYNPGDVLQGSIFTIGNNAGIDGTPEASKKYFTLTETGVLWFCYNNGDGSNQSYADIRGIFGDTGLQTNVWQHIVIQVVPNGNYEVLYTYINGSLVSQIDVYQAASSTIRTDRSVMEYFEQSLPVYYGVPYTDYNDGNDWYSGSGMLDDVSVYSELYSALSVYTQSSIAHSQTLLQSAIDDYLEKMSAIDDQLAVYTNMGDAYNAYNRAQRYIDAVNKGGEEEDAAQYAELYTDLVTATNNMQLYTKPDTVQGMSTSQTGVATSVSAQYTNNMLSTVRLDTAYERDGGTNPDGPYDNAHVMQGTFVWLYTGINGDTPTAPIGGGVYRRTYQTGVYFYGQSIYTTSGDISLNQNWKMSGSSDMDWYYENSSVTDQLGYYQTQTDARYQVSDETTWHNGSNFITYTGGSDSFSSNGDYTDYYYSFTQNYGYRIYTRNFLGTSWNTDGNILSPGSVYVINFARVNQALLDGERLNALSDVSNYTPDSISELLAAYDSLTSQDYMFSSVSEENVQQLAQTLDTKVKTLEGVDLSALEPFADGTELETVRDNESQFHDSVIIQDNGDATIPDGELNAGETYTASSWSAYDKAYNAVKEYYASLNPYGDNEQYATSQDQLDTLITNINSAKAHLVARADYSPVDEAIESTEPNYAETYGLGNGTGYEDQLYTYGSWNNFTSAYDAANAWYQKDAQYRADTEKYSITWVTNENISTNPYVGIDANGDVVTSDSQTPEWYMYVGEFYDSPDDSDPSQFETGDYVMIGGEMIQLNGHRYAPGTIDWDTLSDRQTDINTDGPAVGTTYNQLTAPADYSAYDAATDLLKYQDVAAFTDDYLNSADSVYGTVRDQGTKEGTVNYSNGVGSADDGVSVNTPAYGGESTAYIKDSNNTVWRNQSSQGDLDGVTTRILSDLESVNTTESGNRTRFDVNFSYIDTDGVTQTTVYNGTYYYGETYHAVVPGDRTVYKWVVTVYNNGTDIENGTTMEIPASEYYDAYITGDVTIVAYCTEDTVENEIAVQIQNQYGNLIQEYVVTDDTQITVDRNALTIGENAYTAENTSWLADTPFYTFDGWQVNGHNYNNGTTFTVGDVAEDGVVTLRIKMNVASGYYDVTMDGEGVQNVLTGETGTAFVYDTEVTAMPADGAYGIAIQIGDSYYAVSYGTEPYTFYTVGNAELYSIYLVDDHFEINGESITAESDYDTFRKLDLGLPFSYTIGQSADGKFTSYSATTADLEAIPDGAVVTEVGTLYTTDASVAADPDAFVLGAENVSSVAAKNQLDTMQYFLRFNTGGATVYTRSYVKYSFGDSVSATGHEYSASTVIQTVDYGNIVSGNGSN